MNIITECTVDLLITSLSRLLIVFFFSFSSSVIRSVNTMPFVCTYDHCNYYKKAVFGIGAVYSIEAYVKDCWRVPINTRF